MHCEYFCIKNILNPSSSAHQMGQSIQERTKWNLWETAFKKFHEVHCWILVSQMCIHFSLWNFEYVYTERILNTPTLDKHLIRINLFLNFAFHLRLIICIQRLQPDQSNWMFCITIGQKNYKEDNLKAISPCNFKPALPNHTYLISTSKPFSCFYEC